MMTTRNEAGSGFQAPPNGLIKSDFQTKLAMNKGKQFPGEKNTLAPQHVSTVSAVQNPPLDTGHRRDGL
jgi:hypothetical protein